jgi:hypothetical protein
MDVGRQEGETLQCRCMSLRRMLGRGRRGPKKERRWPTSVRGSGCNSASARHRARAPANAGMRRGCWASPWPGSLRLFRSSVSLPVLHQSILESRSCSLLCELIPGFADVAPAKVRRSRRAVKLGGSVGCMHRSSRQSRPQLAVLAPTRPAQQVEVVPLLLLSPLQAGPSRAIHKAGLKCAPSRQ